MKGQTSLLDEIIVDNFAGGGGASTGIELATGRVVDIAINHDPDAILMHKTNHPHTEHLQASVWDVDPVKVCRGRPVGLAWFSPDCKHFSKAKGAALVDRNIRGLAWIVLRWAGTVRPRVIILENVEEFQTWGPVRRGKPIKSKAGTTFTRWKQQLTDLGYTIEHRELVAADYGAPTTRKRFVLVARCDGRPIVWPEPTHSRDGADGKKPWRAAAEIIDWSLPCPSIFATKAEIKDTYGLSAVRPLAENTMRRVIRGVDKFTIKSGKPFIVGVGGRCGDCPPRCVMEPHRTVTTKADAAFCDPILAPFQLPNFKHSAGDNVNSPVHTVCTAGGGSQMLVTPNLVHCKFDNTPESVTDPLRTITSVNAHLLAAPSLIQYHTERAENVRGQGLNKPINTVDASNRYGLAAANLVEYYGNGNPLDLREPTHTVTSHDRDALTTAILQPCHAGGYHGRGNEPDKPVNTITGAGGQSFIASSLVKFKGTNLGQRQEEPLQTITAEGGEFAECRAYLAKADDRDLRYWPKIRDLLNKYCGYSLADDEVLLLTIGGALYFIADIGLRMLTPRELYNAMGFPTDYIIDRDYRGNEYGKTKQVARCGNAVCPPMAEAVVRANMPEWCQTKIETMKEFNDAVAS